MSFSTLPFLFYFLPAFLAVYYIVPARFRNAVLALGSLLFYWLGAGTGALLVLVALILVNFAAGRLIEDAHGDERRAWLILALACDVGSLFYFKYMGWFLENLGRLTNTDFSFFRVALPLGVSFYVFQSIAYVADVYRGDAEAERQAAVLRAEGEAEAIMKVQTALADSIKLLNSANPNDQVVKLKALESFEKAADGQATKIIVPSEIQSLAGLAASFKGLLEDEKK